MAIELTTANSSQLQGIRESLGVSKFFSPKDYGASGDGQKILGMSKASGSTTVLTGAPAGTFTASDVGKVAWAMLTGGTVVVSQGTIAAVNSDTSVTLSGTANGSSFSGSVVLFFGSDDTASIQACWAATKAAGGIMYIPIGNYFVNRQVAGVDVDNSKLTSIIGDGSLHSRITLMPDFSFSGAVGTGVIYLRNSGFVSCCGIGIDGGSFSFSFSGYYGFFLSNLSSSAKQRNSGLFVDLSIEDHKGFTASIAFETTYNTKIESLIAYNCGYVGINFNGSRALVTNILSSNGGGFGVKIVGGASITIVNSTIDEHSASSLTIEDSGSEVQFYGSKIYGGAGLTAMTIASGSTAYFHNSRVEPYNSHPNSSSISVASGGTLISENTRITGTGTGKCITGAGTFIDGGGNTLTGTVDVTTAKGVAFNYPISLATKTPASASDAGVAGQIAWDASYIYICTATNTWKRVAIATW